MKEMGLFSGFLVGTLNCIFRGSIALSFFYFLLRCYFVLPERARDLYLFFLIVSLLF